MSETSTTRVTKRRAETRQNLLEASHQVFVDKGFGATRIEDVCRAAGYTRGAFYSQFETLNELFYEICVRRIDELIAEVDAEVDSHQVCDVPSLVSVAVGALSFDRAWCVLFVEFRLRSLRDEKCLELWGQTRERILAGIAARLDASIPQVDSLAGQSGIELAREVLPLLNAAQESVATGEPVAEAREWLQTASCAIIEHAVRGGRGGASLS